jgi:hypothetical protein
LPHADAAPADIAANTAARTSQRVCFTKEVYLRSVNVRTLILAIFVVGCGATNGGLRFDATPAKPPPELTTARNSSPEVGVLVLVSDAIANLQLDHGQNDQLVQLVTSVKEKHERVEEMRKVLSIDMASSVAAGVIDDKTLELDAKKLGAARAETAPIDGKALEDLHRILNPAQRKQFATALAARADNLPTDDAQMRYASWRSDLEITVIQNEKIEPKLGDETTIAPSAKAEHDAWQKRLRDTAAAFDKEQFSAASSYVDPDVEKTTTERVRRVIVFLKLVVPELTQKQQAAAAENLRAEAGAKN